MPLPTYRSLLAVLAGAALLAPAAPAVAGGKHGGHDAQEQAGKRHQPRGSQRCRGGAAYRASGMLAAGSTLQQVAGAGTRRVGDDRWSGTLVVDVTGGNRRGRADVGQRSYVLDGVRLTGNTKVLAPGTRVEVHGRRRAASCAGAAGSEAAADVAVRRVALRAPRGKQGGKGEGAGERRGDDAVPGAEAEDEDEVAEDAEDEEVADDEAAGDDEAAADDPWGTAPWNRGPGSDREPEAEGDDD